MSLNQPPAMSPGINAPPQALTASQPPGYAQNFNNVSVMARDTQQNLSKTTAADQESATAIANGSVLQIAEGTLLSLTKMAETASVDFATEEATEAGKWMGMASRLS